MTRQMEEETGRAGNPFLRLLQPEEPNAPYEDSSYFRLGSYVAYNSEEDPLVTHLHTTRSRTSKAAAAKGTTTVPTAGPLGPSFGASFNARSPGAASLDAVPSSPIPSSNYGVLLYTDRDLNETVKGAVLQKYGQGQVTEITDCDAAYSVLNGKYDLFASNGINIIAGDEHNPSNIHVRAQGHYTETAHGDRFTKIFGYTHSEFMGESTAVFAGDRSSVVIGHELVLKLSISKMVILGIDEYYRLGGRIQVILSIDSGIIIGRARLKIIGTKWDMIEGYEEKFNIGDTWKYVSGKDIAFKTVDWKTIRTSDTVICPGTSLGVKNRVISITNISASHEKASSENSDFKAVKSKLEEHMNSIWVNSTDATKLEKAAVHLFT